VSAALVGELRAGRAPLDLASGAGAITVRVQVAEMWDAIRVNAHPDTAISELKQRVVNEFFPGHEYLDDFVLKLRGWEMLDESQSLKTGGMVDGSIVLLSRRRRRPVR
jgi:hypothetical protein